MGGAGDSPAPVGDPPTGTAASYVAKRPYSLRSICYRRCVVPKIGCRATPPTRSAASHLSRNRFPLSRTVAIVQCHHGTWIIPYRSSVRILLCCLRYLLFKFWSCAL